ncbi:BspA family leucine-rich repeat surface protein [Roseobacter sp. EG26]|uniref:BspA family leucine-rich repeat surface protein n=1 Tax=Roseobacter sp. EG26 TaxID=3412477 RepID=UPI003CE54EA0
MPGIGFVGPVAARRRKRSGQTPPVSISASVPPASSALVVGEALNDTANWAVFTDPANYATTAPGQTVASVVVTYIGDTATAAEVFADGDVNNFALTVTDTGGNTRIFTVTPRIVVYQAPAVTGALADQSLTLGTGVQTYDASGAFTGDGLAFSVSATPGVSINGTTGVISFDTDVMTPQSGVTIVVSAANSGGSVQNSLELESVAPIVYTAQITGLTANPTHGLTAQIGVPLTGLIPNLQGGETVVHGWRDDSGLISGATAASYTPVAGQDLQTIRYAPNVNGEDVLSLGHTVRHAPPVAGSLAAVVETQGTGTPTVNLAAGFTGSNLIYSENVAWAVITGSTLTINDELRTDTLRITATNSGGSAEVDLSVTITAPVTAPAQMNAPSLVVNSASQITASLAADPDDGGAPITQRDLRYRENGGSWTTQANVGSTVLLTGLTEDTDHDVQTRARNSVGIGSWSASASGRTLLSAPLSAGNLTDQSFAENTGAQTYDVSGDFTGLNLVYSVNAIPGVTIDQNTGLVTFDTDAMSIQADTAIVVSATNARGTAQSGFSLTIVDVVETGFVLTVETTTPNETFTVPFRNASAGFYSGTIEDSVNGVRPYNSHNDANLSITFPVAGTHTIRISGTAFGMNCSANPADAARIRTVENFGQLGWRDMVNAFSGCTGMTSFTAGNTDTSAAQNWFSAFAGCTSMTTCDIAGFDFSAATNLQNTWGNCSALTAFDATGMDTGNVTRMDEAFLGCTGLDGALDISGFDIRSLAPPSGGEQRGMFDIVIGFTLSQSVYDACLINFAAQTPLPTGPIFFGAGIGTDYTRGGAAEAARTALINAGWFLNDAGVGVPAAMGAPSLVADSSTQITVTLGAAPPLDGLQISSYDLRYSTDQAIWTEIDDISSPLPLPGLLEGTIYYVEMRAVNYLGEGAWSTSASVTTQTPSASYVFSNNMNGTVTFMTAAPPPSPIFDDNEDGTVERTA